MAMNEGRFSKCEEMKTKQLGADAKCARCRGKIYAGDVFYVDPDREAYRPDLWDVPEEVRVCSKCAATEGGMHSVEEENETETVK